MRVYRSIKKEVPALDISLTICEGISSVFFIVRAIELFPSLYVRVYHVVPSLLLSFRLSITICEGISMIREMMEYIRIFPHYM